MSPRYRIAAGALVVLVLGGVVWARVRSPRTPAVADTAVSEVCESECALPPAMWGSGEPMPAIPTGSGLPCLVEFGSDECKACQNMVKVLDAIGPRLEGKADIVRVDTDEHPLAAKDWSLRMIPTQVAVSPDGKELWRHEGFIPEDELLGELAKVGIETGEAARPVEDAQGSSSD